MLTATENKYNLPFKDECKGGLCMKGGIYSTQKCSICGGPFKDNHKDGLLCQVHNNQRANKFIVKFPGVWRRFNTYQSAQRFLTGLRFKTDEGSFDARDYQQEAVLGFDTQARKWLEHKKPDIKASTYRNLINYINRAASEWGNRNVKEIGFAEIDDFKTTQVKSLSTKTVWNMMCALREFFNWFASRENKAGKGQRYYPPEFPETSFKLKMRTVISRDVQVQILEEVMRISYHINPKIWLGIKMLMTYPRLRPKELLEIRERDIDFENRSLIAVYTKEGDPKHVYLVQDDIEILKQFPNTFPMARFFRHEGGIQSVKAGDPFGEKYLYKWWKKACANLGVEGVDLYGGTKHSTLRYLRKHRSYEDCKLASGHKTNKALDRYIQDQSDIVKELYEITKIATNVQPLFKKANDGK